MANSLDSRVENIERLILRLSLEADAVLAEIRQVHAYMQTIGFSSEEVTKKCSYGSAEYEIALSASKYRKMLAEKAKNG